jgi:hypothetical protein
MYSSPKDDIKVRPPGFPVLNKIDQSAISNQQTANSKQPASKPFADC